MPDIRTCKHCNKSIELWEFHSGETGWMHVPEGFAGCGFEAEPAEIGQ